MVSFEDFVKSMPPSLWELKVITSFCFAFKIPDNMTATTSRATLEYEVLSLKYDVRDVSTNADFAG